MSSSAISQLSDSIHLVRGKANGKFPYAHGFLITGDENVLIDAGAGESAIREADEIFRIDALIITHSHPDHIRSWRLLEDRRLLLPAETPDSVCDLTRLGRRFTGDPDDGVYWAKAVARDFGVQALRAPDGRFCDRESIDLGNAELEAIFTPGHVADHYCFLEKRSGTLFTVDVDLTSFGPWYGNPESDIELFKESVSRLMQTPYERVCSSHRDPLVGDVTELFEDFLEVFDRHKRLILELCDTPRSIEELTAMSPIYRDSMPDKTFQRIFEGNMIAKNIAILGKEGAVVESGGRYLRA